MITLVWFVWTLLHSSSILSKANIIQITREDFCYFGFSDIVYNQCLILIQWNLMRVYYNFVDFEIDTICGAFFF